jgi:predicted nucleic acid-binding Zn ribbon protein
VFRGSGWYIKDSKGQSNLAVPPKHDKDGTGNGTKTEPSTKASTSDTSTPKED